MLMHALATVHCRSWSDAANVDVQPWLVDREFGAQFYGRCLFQFMFNPTRKLEEATDRALKTVLGSPKASYISCG
jgi:hypothetical protein